MYSKTDRKNGLELITAAENNGVEAVKALLNRGAYIHAQDKEGRCALVAAAYRNHLEIAELLIAAGADVNMKDNTLQSAYLISTCEVGDNTELLKKTLKAGADVYATDSYNGTGLIRAADRGFVEIIRELLKTDIRVNHVNNLGWTALLEAIILGDGGSRHTEIVRLLVEAGADVNLPDKDGVTPLTHAKKKNFTEIVKILDNTGAMEQNFETARDKMVEEQLKPRGIKSDSVLDAMRNVPRHLFVPEHLQYYAYDDSPLIIGAMQTISQPYIVALMTELLEPVRGMKILEIGTGSGYQAAVLAYLGCEVYTVEYVEELAAKAKKIFAALNMNNIDTRHGNGYAGWAEEAPFDAIIVTAAPDTVPEKLVEQLKDRGKMIVPVGKFNSAQELKLITKKDGTILEQDLLSVRFVPMVQ
jgi:protein-L-isoaspartate(D-aspartate) O-methyltransferase